MNILGIPSSSSTSLDSARIVIISPQYVRKEYHRIHRLLACLSSAKDLTLLDHTLEVLKGEELGGTMPIFKNLTRLEIDIIYSSRFNFNKPLQMLQLCPILEVLIINEGIYYQDKGFDNIDTRPLSLPSHLKIIEVHKFGGGAWSLNVVKSPCSEEDNYFAIFSFEAERAWRKCKRFWNDY